MQKFLNQSLANRLKLGFASVLLLLLCIAAMGTFSLRQASKDMKLVVEVNATRSGLANELLIEGLAEFPKPVELTAR
jgi:hypothetical protein